MITFNGRTLEEYALLDHWADAVGLKAPGNIFGGFLALDAYLRWLSRSWESKHPGVKVSAMNIARVLPHGK
jgi:hypothetical protein